MSVQYSISFNHFIRIIFENENSYNMPGVHIFFHNQLAVAQSAVRELLESKTPIIKIDFYTDAHMIASDKPNIAHSNEFGRVEFSPEEFLRATNTNLGDAIVKGLAEVDEIMEKRGATRAQ